MTRGILEVTVRCPFSLMWRQWAHKLLNAEFWDFLRQWQPWYTKAPAKGDQEPASNSCMRPVQRTNEERNWIQPAGEQDRPSLYPIRAPRPAARQGKNSGRSTCGLYIATCNNLASEAPAWRVDCRGPQQVPARRTLPPPSAAKSHRRSTRRRCATNTPEVAVQWYLLRVAEYRDERVCLCIYLSMCASTFPRELHCEFKKKQETAALSETSLSVYW